MFYIWFQYLFEYNKKFLVYQLSKFGISPYCDLRLISILSINYYYNIIWFMFFLVVNKKEEKLTADGENNHLTMYKK